MEIILTKRWPWLVSVFNL